MVEGPRALTCPPPSYVMAGLFRMAEGGLQGTVALIDEAVMDYSVVCGLFGGGVEQSVDERDLSRDPWLFVMDVTAFDRSYRLEPA